MVILRPEMSNEEMVTLLNKEISGRRNYGRRVESAGGKKPWRRVQFSVGHGDWWQHWDAQRGPVSLDANEIGVTGISRQRLEPILEDLSTLPLYYGSYEARQKGQYSLEGIDIPPAIREAYSIKQTALDERKVE